MRRYLLIGAVLLSLAMPATPAAGLEFGRIGPMGDRGLLNNGRLLRPAGTMTDLGNFPGYNAVYQEFFSEPYPARSSVGASLAPGVLVEIEAVARRRP